MWQLRDLQDLCGFGGVTPGSGAEGFGNCYAAVSVSFGETPRYAIDTGIGRITIAPDDTVHVYTPQGTLVYAGRYADARPAPGIYLVRRGKETAKVIVR